MGRRLRACTDAVGGYSTCAAALHAIFRAARESSAQQTAACATFVFGCQDFDGAILLADVTMARLTYASESNVIVQEAVVEWHTCQYNVFLVSIIFINYEFKAEGT